MKSTLRFIPGILLILCSSLLLIHCGGSGTSQSTISGSVVMAPVDAADVAVHVLNADGTLGDTLAVTVTNKEGSFSVTGDFSGPVAVVATLNPSASYRDEATGQTVNGDGSALTTDLPDGANPGSYVGVNALTTIAAAHANAHASEGLAKAIASASKEIAGEFGIPGVDITHTKPTDLTVPDAASSNPNAPETKLGLILAAISQVAADPSEVLGMIQEWAQAFNEGTLNNDNAFQGVPIAIVNFANGPQNESGFKPDDVGVIPPTPSH